MCLSVCVCICVCALSNMHNDADIQEKAPDGKDAWLGHLGLITWFVNEVNSVIIV